MILQDPFVLNHNITQNVNEKMVIKMLKEMQLAEVKAAGWFNVANAETKSIMDILGDEVPEGFEVKKVKLAQKARGLPDLGPYQFLIELNMDKLSRADFQNLHATGNMHLTWCRKMMVFLYRLIERVLMFDCDLANANFPVTLKPSRKYSIYRQVEEPYRPTLNEDQGGDEMEFTQEAGEEGQEGANQEVETSPDSKGDWSNPDQPSTSQSDNQSVPVKDTPEESTPAQPTSSVDVDDEDYNFGPHGGWAPAGEGPMLPSVVDGTELVAVVDLEEEEENSREDDGKKVKEEAGSHNPSYIQYDFEDSELYIDMDVKVMCRIWVERKNLMKELKERGLGENLQLEQTVSERLFYEVHGPAKRPITEFRCVLRSIVSDSGASVLVDCMADERQKEYNCIYHYMKKFAIKCVEKFFYA